MITSNQIHMLIVDTGERDVIPKSMQLIAGRAGQEYNQRKNRRGAFWEDRYHATAVETGEHLARCLVYIRIWYAAVWSATRQSGLSAAIARSKNPEGKT
jgi:hypothetical protein